MRRAVCCWILMSSSSDNSGKEQQLLLQAVQGLLLFLQEHKNRNSGISTYFSFGKLWHEICVIPRHNEILEKISITEGAHL